MNIQLLVIFFCISTFAFSQANLVQNGSFEEKSYCPSNYNQQQLKIITNWNQPGEGTPDYFNACSDKVGVPKNLFGEEMAEEGEAYAGLVTFSPGRRNYREYLQTKLSRALTADEKVCIEMFVSAADFSKYVTDGIGICLTKDRIASNRNEVLQADPSIENPRLNMLDQAEGWLKISDIYTAAGGEQYLTIGNFKNDVELKIIRRTKEMGATEVSQWSYVYVDNISVTPITGPEDCSCTIPLLAEGVHDPPLELEEYEQIKLDAILFDFDEDVLTRDAKEQLNGLYRLLEKNRFMYMEIIGHTDIIGNDEYNIELSKRRAASVIQFLEHKGINEKRLKMMYYGATQPVAENDTEEGRHRNRRVEFQILEKKFELYQ